MERIAAAHRARVCWRPILLGALFRELGTPDVPSLHHRPGQAALHAPRPQRLGRALARPLSFPQPLPDPHRRPPPPRPLLDPALILPLFHACWAEDRAIDDPAVLAELLRAAGHDPEDMLRRAEDPAIKAALRHNTEAAREAGLLRRPQHGRPSPPQPAGAALGQDRLGMLEDVLAGWQPPAAEPTSGLWPLSSRSSSRSPTRGTARCCSRRSSRPGSRSPRSTCRSDSSRCCRRSARSPRTRRRRCRCRSSRRCTAGPCSGPSS
ncbi:MAG: DsbA family protein [Nannocystis sp.]|nr:DsbA family protein [Nannocystis sp.]